MAFATSMGLPLYLGESSLSEFLAGLKYPQTGLIGASTYPRQVTLIYPWHNPTPALAWVKFTTPAFGALYTPKP